MNSTFEIMNERPLIPGLFQLAASAGRPATQNIFTLGQTPFAEMMLNPEKLEAILRVIARPEKPAARRISAGRVVKMPSARATRTD